MVAGDASRGQEITDKALADKIFAVVLVAQPSDLFWPCFSLCVPPSSSSADRCALVDTSKLSQSPSLSCIALKAALLHPPAPFLVTDT
jgi:hypothetical protein